MHVLLILNLILINADTYTYTYAFKDKDISSASISLPNFEYAPEIIERGKDNYIKIKDASKSETFLNHIFGTDCYSKAIHLIHAECRHLTSEQQSYLAWSLTNCFLENSGKKTFECHSTKSLKHCLSSLDNNAFQTYQQFFINIYSICIFVENMNIQKQAAWMVKELYNSSEHALRQMNAMQDQIEKQENYLQLISNRIINMMQSQTKLEDDIKSNIKNINQLKDKSDDINEKLRHSLELEDKLHQSQEDVVNKITELNDLEIDRAEQNDKQWKIFEERTQQMEDWTLKYEETQDVLMETSEKLILKSNKIETTIEGLVKIEEKSEKALSQLMGRTTRIKDIVFYVLGLGIAFLIGNVKMTENAAIPLFLIFTIGFIFQRLILDVCHNYLRYGDSEQIYFDFPCQSILLSTLNFIFGKHFDIIFIIHTLCIILSIMTIIYVMVNYNDVNKENTSILMRIEAQIRESERCVMNAVRRSERMDDSISDDMNGNRYKVKIKRTNM